MGRHLTRLEPSILSTSRLPALTLALLLVAACGGSAATAVDRDSYGALVPTREQAATEAGEWIPGGFGPLSDAGVEDVGLRIDEETATFLLDGSEVATLPIIERVTVIDAEGSGPFKGRKQVLMLGGGPLTLGPLTIDDPVVWPGSFEDSPVITVKPRDPSDRGPGVSCTHQEACLLFTADVDATGSYADANDPSLDQNPVETIDVRADEVALRLDDGTEIVVDSSAESTRACGLAATQVWEIPKVVNLSMTEPILVHSQCPSTPGGSIQLIIIERADLPVLAPLDPATDGDWCSAGPGCLWFVPI